VSQLCFGTSLAERASRRSWLPGPDALAVFSRQRARSNSTPSTSTPSAVTVRNGHARLALPAPAPPSVPATGSRAAHPRQRSRLGPPVLTRPRRTCGGPVSPRSRPPPPVSDPAPVPAVDCGHAAVPPEVHGRPCGAGPPGPQCLPQSPPPGPPRRLRLARAACCSRAACGRDSLHEVPAWPAVLRCPGPPGSRRPRAGRHRPCPVFKRDHGRRGVCGARCVPPAVTQSRCPVTHAAACGA